jgi:hypothetical protein
MFKWFRRKSLDEVVNAKKSVTINGVLFILKKIDPLHHMKGLKVMRSTFDLYRLKGGSQELSDGEAKKIREHYRDVFLSGVVRPKLSREDGEDSVFVDEIFLDQDMTEKLYMEIMYHTYGKKNLISSILTESA